MCAGEAATLPDMADPLRREFSVDLPATTVEEAVRQLRLGAKREGLVLNATVPQDIWCHESASSGIARFHGGLRESDGHLVLAGTIQQPSGQLYQALFRALVSLASVAAIVVALVRHPFYAPLFWIGVVGTVVFGGLTIMTARVWRPAFAAAATQLTDRITRMTQVSA